jgi:transketolase
MRRTFKTLLADEMAENDKITVLLGDIGYGMFDNLRQTFPDRVINVGSSEQLMIGMAVGCAMEGKLSVCYSITSFILYRPFEFIRNYLSHEQIPVKLVGGGRNEDYGPCGFSHYACEDISVLNAIGGIKMYHPTDKDDIDIKGFLYEDNPSYMNLRR